MKAILIALSVAAVGSAGALTAFDCDRCGSEPLIACPLLLPEGSAAPTLAPARGPSSAVTFEVVGERASAGVELRADTVRADTVRADTVRADTVRADTVRADTVRADYVEARSASVFAGACHVASEADSQGRQALMAWSITEGTVDGVDLAGARVVAAVSGRENLATGAERQCAVWIDAPGGEAQFEAARAWFDAAHGEAVGSVRSVQAQPVSFERDGNAFAVQVGDVIRLAGDAIADGSCCSMQEHRWYEPLGADAGLPVGVPETCSFAGAAGLPSWRYEGQNNVFVGEYVGQLAGRCAGTSEGCQPWSDTLDT
ncbi:DUF1326 domain-containing protein [Engelhardtia mirabilis]|uniref:Uncharacterized protein n=1 Tax=Engelhardtia mirabilis TaxID=2528011 RepID=A0A518BS39_9BACT|nr:hypothetical protein Pla133_49140 [Planctomycetes bacterium Pla133]QDV04118.1 hypothetical protein Pla86_49120 [Planctomycetes bacterium Pla86]